MQSTRLTSSTWISLDGAGSRRELSYDAGSGRGLQRPNRPGPPLDDESPYCILYTSGTTGKPKGAVLPHRQILWNCINTVVSWGLSENDVSPVLTPLFHAGGLFAFLTPLLYAGGRIILAEGFDAEQSLRVIQDEGCTVILGVPTLFQMWLDAPGFAACRLQRRALFHQRRRAAAGAAGRSLASTEGRGFPPGLRSDRGWPELLQHDRRRVVPEDRLGGQADLPQPDAAGGLGDGLGRAGRRDRRAVDQGAARVQRLLAEPRGHGQVAGGWLVPHRRHGAAWTKTASSPSPAASKT